jgi:hypothetical protein
MRQDCTKPFMSECPFLAEVTHTSLQSALLIANIDTHKNYITLLQTPKIEACDPNYPELGFNYLILRGGAHQSIATLADRRLGVYFKNLSLVSLYKTD